MARIPDAEINKLKTEVSLLRLIERQGYRPQQQGKDYAIPCPFHDSDDTPSLIITPRKNLFHCFGCEAAGTVIDWVMKTQGVSFRHAVEILQQDAVHGCTNVAGGRKPGATSPALAAEPTPVKRSTQKKLASLPLDHYGQALLNQVIDFYRETLVRENLQRGLRYVNNLHVEVFKLTQSYYVCNTVETRRSKCLSAQLQFCF